MPESAEELYARVAAAADDTGRLPAPPITGWDVFPWEVVDGAIVPKPLMPPTDDGPRQGEGGRECPSCSGDVDERTIWTDGTWRVVHLARSGLPIVVILETVAHLDVPDLDQDQAAELGRLTVRLVRIIEAMPHIGRLHVDRWGDGSAHLHIWFFARPARQPAILGSYAVEWDEILPPVPEAGWRADLAAVADGLAAYGGEAVISGPPPTATAPGDPAATS